ncbi:MAG: hypothetical protein M3083_19685 [Actinomycetota bacterium]|nr:hypothetical protein [Actinomycetota bacterium]
MTAAAMTLALAKEHVTMWWISIGIGFVVVLVVIVLLSLLIALVQDIDRNVKSLWNVATRLARNTATTWMLNQTAAATAALRDETALHAQGLSALANSSRAPAGAGAPGGPTGARARKRMI